MKLTNLAAIAAISASLVSATASAAPVRASDSALVSAPAGARIGALKGAPVRASKQAGEQDSLLGAPLFLAFLGAVAVTIGTIVVVNNDGSN